MRDNKLSRLNLARRCFSIFIDFDKIFLKYYQYSNMKIKEKNVSPKLILSFCVYLKEKKLYLELTHLRYSPKLNFLPYDLT